MTFAYSKHREVRFPCLRGEALVSQEYRKAAKEVFRDRKWAHNRVQCTVLVKVLQCCAIGPLS